MLRTLEASLVCIWRFSFRKTVCMLKTRLTGDKRQIHGGNASDKRRILLAAQSLVGLVSYEKRANNLNQSKNGFEARFLPIRSLQRTFRVSTRLLSAMRPRARRARCRAENGAFDRRNSDGRRRSSCRSDSMRSKRRSDLAAPSRERRSNRRQQRRRRCFAIRRLQWRRVLAAVQTAN